MDGGVVFVSAWVSPAVIREQRGDKHLRGQRYRAVAVPCVTCSMTTGFLLLPQSCAFHSLTVCSPSLQRCDRCPILVVLLRSDHMRMPDWCVWMWAFGVIGIKLPFPPRKLCNGSFGSDGCWLGSSAPRLQMPFEDCFHPSLETQGQIRNRLSSLEIQKAASHICTNTHAQCNFSFYLFSSLLVPYVRWVCMHTRSHTPRKKTAQIVFACSQAISFKEKKKMPRTIGLENPLTPQSSTTPPCHLIFPIQHANQKRSRPAISRWDQQLCLSPCHECLKSNTV